MIDMINGVTLREDDYFLISYPRSGNTWLRTMLTYLHPGVVIDREVRNIHHVIPNLDQSPVEATIPHPRLIKTHSLFDSRLKNVIYLLRDGRDSMCSYYEFSKKEFDYSGTLLEFLKNPQFGLRWTEHVQSWLGNTTANLLLIRYEEMLQNPITNLSRAVKFLDWDISTELIEKAVTSFRIENMRLREQSGEFLAHVGSGRQGRWRQDMTDEGLCFFLEEAEPMLRNHGYIET